MVGQEVKRKRRRTWDAKGFSKSCSQSRGVNHDEVVERFAKFSQKEDDIINGRRLVEVNDRDCVNTAEGYKAYLYLTSLPKRIKSRVFTAWQAKRQCTLCCIVRSVLISLFIWLGGLSWIILAVILSLFD